jgi:hypothetical protein
MVQQACSQVQTRVNGNITPLAVACRNAQGAPQADQSSRLGEELTGCLGTHRHFTFKGEQPRAGLSSKT